MAVIQCRRIQTVRRGRTQGFLCPSGITLPHHAVKIIDNRNVGTVYITKSKELRDTDVSRLRSNRYV